jgi:tetratricopeptide (TPR) repeat protein
MKTLCLLLLIFSTPLTTPLTAEDSPEALIANAAALNDQGDFRAVIRLLEPLVQSNTLDRQETGVAFDLLGTAYEFMGEYNRSRGSFDAALKALAGNPAQIRQYAAALGNLGTLELEEGHADAAAAADSKSLRLYQQLGDHAGVAREAGKVAQIALKNGRYGDANKFLAEGFRESAFLQAPDTENLIFLYAIQTIVAAHKLGWMSALENIQHAIDLCAAQRRAPYFMVANLYLVRGEVYDKLGEFNKAAADLNYALERLDGTAGSESPIYLRIQLAYAGVLRDSGSKQAAAVLEQKAKVSFEELFRRQCVESCVSILSLR